MRKDDLLALFEECIGCRWTIPLLRAIRDGTRRPGALERALGEISTKVLNERLARMQAFGLVERREFDERLPRVEYTLTPRGERVAELLRQAEEVLAEP